MKNFKAIMFLVVVMLFGCMAQVGFSQECLNGKCSTNFSVLDRVVEAPIQVASAPIRMVSGVIQNRPLRKFAASRPLRRVFGGVFRCR